MTTMRGMRRWARTPQDRRSRSARNFSLPTAMEGRLGGRGNRLCDARSRTHRRALAAWRRAATLAAEHRMPMSSHLFPGSQRRISWR